MKSFVWLIVMALAGCSGDSTVNFKQALGLKQPEPDAQRIEQRKVAPSLAKVEKLAGRWDAVAIECDPDSSQARWGYGPWEVQFVAADLRNPRYHNSDVTIIGWGYSLEAAAKNAIRAWYRRRAELASDAVTEERNRALTPKDSCAGCDH